MIKILKIRPRENALTFSSEGVLAQTRALINSTRLDLQNKKYFRQNYFLSKKLGSIEVTKQNDNLPWDFDHFDQKMTI